MVRNGNSSPAIGPTVSGSGRLVPKPATAEVGPDKPFCVLLAHFTSAQTEKLRPAYGRFGPARDQP
jgi:hypothetical protein